MSDVFYLLVGYGIGMMLAPVVILVMIKLGWFDKIVDWLLNWTEK